MANFAPLLHKRLYCFKLLALDNCLVMILHSKLFMLSGVFYPLAGRILRNKCLVENDVPAVFLIGEHLLYGALGPDCLPSRRRNAFLLKHGLYGIRALPGKIAVKDAPDYGCFILYDDEIITGRLIAIAFSGIDRRIFILRALGNAPFDGFALVEGFSSATAAASDMDNSPEGSSECIFSDMK